MSGEKVKKWIAAIEEKLEGISTAAQSFRISAKEELDKLIESHKRVEELEKKIEFNNMFNENIDEAVKRYPECRYVMVDLEKWNSEFMSENKFEQLKEAARLGEAIKAFFNKYPNGLIEDYYGNVKIKSAKSSLLDWYEKLEKDNKQ